MPQLLGSNRDRDGAEEEAPVAADSLQVTGDAVRAAMALQLLYEIQDYVPLFCLH